MLGHLVLLAFLQVASPAAPTAAPALEAQADASAAAPAAEPEMICRMEPVTGSRVRKQKVCRPKSGLNPETEQAQDMLRQLQRGGSTIQLPATGG